MIIIKNKIVLQVLAGGEGLRIKKYINNETKQFQKLLPNQDKTMLQYTIDLYKETKLINDTIIITLNKYKNEIKKIVTKSQKIIYEPYKRGTQYQIQTMLSNSNININDIVIISPSDHYFKNTEKLKFQLQNAIELQENTEKIILLGSNINKDYINIQYGWIKTKHNIKTNDMYICGVDKFIEKPQYNKQIKIINDGNLYFYNMGIFIGKVQTFYDVICKQNYRIYKHIINLRYNVNNLKTIYNKIEEKSFDKEILEKVNDRLIVISDNYGWDDIGLIDNLKKVQQQVI